MPSEECASLLSQAGSLKTCMLFHLQEGGGRKGLPKSFLNRFSRVHIDLLESADMLKIAGAPPLAGVFTHHCTPACSTISLVAWQTRQP